MSKNALRAALVTGAGSGIGRAIAKRFEQNGWTVFGFDVLLPDGARAVVGDVRSQEEWATLARRIDSDIGRTCW
jgi:NAD(P)-dependent dehydrogenase (short-subunit alcohol dehydrogenase family)